VSGRGPNLWRAVGGLLYLACGRARLKRRGRSSIAAEGKKGGGKSAPTLEGLQAHALPCLMLERVRLKQRGKSGGGGGGRKGVSGRGPGLWQAVCTLLYLVCERMRLKRRGRSVIAAEGRKGGSESAPFPGELQAFTLLFLVCERMRLKRRGRSGIAAEGRNGHCLIAVILHLQLRDVI